LPEEEGEKGTEIESKKITENNLTLHTGGGREEGRGGRGGGGGEEGRGGGRGGG